MAEISGQPIVNKSDSVVATNLRPQDYFNNPPTSTWAFDTRAVMNVNTKDATPTSGTVLAGMGQLNVLQAFTTSGRTNTAVGSGIFAPLGFFAAQVSGNTVVIPYFAP